MVQFKLSFGTVSHFVMKMCLVTRLDGMKQRMLFDHLNQLFSKERQ
jgi:hypothetical protein